MPITDQYNLQAGSELDLAQKQELAQNISLNKSSADLGGSISGRVTSTAGAPIPSATVKIFDRQANPLYHTVTGSDGYYAFDNIPNGSYLITAAKDGYRIPALKAVALELNASITLNITVDLRTDNKLAILYGSILQTSTAEPIVGATVKVYRVVNGASELVRTTLTNDNGQYLAPGLTPDAAYRIVAGKEGYLSKESDTVTLGAGDISQLNLQLNISSTTLLGTISGVVFDEATGLPIPNATVALYYLEGGNEVILYTAQTNSEGVYLFGSLPAGSYLVKAIGTELP